MKYEIEIENGWSFLLNDVITDAIRTKWKESVWFAKVTESDDILWDESIDQLADLKLQVMKQRDNYYI